MIKMTDLQPVYTCGIYAEYLYTPVGLRNVGPILLICSLTTFFESPKKLLVD